MVTSQLVSLNPQAEHHAVVTKLLVTDRQRDNVQIDAHVLLWQFKFRESVFTKFHKSDITFQSRRAYTITSGTLCSSCWPNLEHGRYCSVLGNAARGYT